MSQIDCVTNSLHISAEDTKNSNVTESNGKPNENSPSKERHCTRALFFYKSILLVENPTYQNRMVKGQLWHRIKAFSYKMFDLLSTPLVLNS